MFGSTWCLLLCQSDSLLSLSTWKVHLKSQGYVKRRSPTKASEILTSAYTFKGLSLENYNAFAWVADKLHCERRKHQKHYSSLFLKSIFVHKLLVMSADFSSCIPIKQQNWTLSAERSILNTSVRKQAHLKTRLKKGQTGGLKTTKNSHMNACIYLFWNWYTADYHKLAFHMIHAHCIST